MSAPADGPGDLRGVVAVGASAGGIEAVNRFVGGLPRNFPFGVLISVHVAPTAPSLLARIIDRAGILPAVTGAHGDQIRPGKIYVAVPDHHLLLDGTRIAVTRGPSENGYRPAINALFRSVAISCGIHAIGVLMSGTLDDGVQGLAAIRARGGTTMVQDPSDALFPGMPANALAAGVVDTQASASELGNLINQLPPVELDAEPSPVEPQLAMENRIAMGETRPWSVDADSLGEPSGFVCPDCNGGLIAINEHSFRCYVGHAWTAESLLRARDAEVDHALWTAIRSLGEKSRLSRQVARRIGTGNLRDHYTNAADEAEHAMNVLAERLAGSTSPAPPPDD
jgi:two-component system chemotaxis response regulator CheB